MTTVVAHGTHDHSHQHAVDAANAVCWYIPTDRGCVVSAAASRCLSYGNDINVG